MSTETQITLRGCRQHNLQNLDVTLPATGLTLITGPSGSGKSSLALATLHAESRRRYLDSLSTSERSRLEHVAPPQLDEADNLPLTVSVHHDSLSTGPRNTLGTATGLIQKLQIIFASSSEAYCPDCQIPIRRWQAQEILDCLDSVTEGTRLQLGFPFRQSVTAEDASAWLQASGFRRVIHDGEMMSLSDYASDDSRQPTGELVVLVDRIRWGSHDDSRLRESIETCFRAGQGWFLLYVEGEGGSEEWNSLLLDDSCWSVRQFCQERDCPDCGRSISDPEPSLFRWTSPLGACIACRGRGVISPASTSQSHRSERSTCPECLGTRLNADARCYRLSGKSLPDVHALTVSSLEDWVTAHLKDHSLQGELLRRIDSLSHFNLSRFRLNLGVDQLSRSERMAIALSNAAVEPLSGALYLLDDPYVGHLRTDWPLVDTAIHQILSQGAGVCCVQARSEPLEASETLAVDCTLRLGPGAGISGGKLYEQSESLSDANRDLEIPATASNQNRETFTLKEIGWPEIAEAELKLAPSGITVLTGSLSTRPIMLARERLIPVLSGGESGSDSGVNSQEILPFEQVESLSSDSRKPHPRKMVITAMGAFGGVRQLYAETEDARKQNISASDLSLHKKEGNRCFQCEGTGKVDVELDFLPEFAMTCPDCGGTRYESRLSEIRFRGLSLPELLNKTVEESFRIFKDHRSVQKKLRSLKQVRLGYLLLGQSLTELSRGEIQRLRLAALLGKIRVPKTLLVIEEISTGLATEELPSLHQTLQEFTASGHSVLLIDSHEFWKDYSDLYQSLTPVM